MASIAQDSKQRMAGYSTIEILLYGSVTAWAVYNLFIEAMDLSNDAQEHIHVQGVREGWFLGWQMDLSDHQWREFRHSMHILAAVMKAFVVLSFLVRKYVPGLQLTFYITFSLVFVGVLHGATILFILALVLVNYCLATALAGSAYALPVIWTWNLGSLLAARVYDGFQFSTLMGDSLSWLDDYRGMLRWHIHYNLLVLRAISFAADLHWTRAKRAPRVKGLPPDTPPSADLDLRARAELWLPLRCYSLGTYLAYLFYPPLYIAGPTMTFNSFASQLEARANISKGQVVRYGLRLLANLLVLELLLHCCHTNGLAKGRTWQLLESTSGQVLGPLRTSALGFWVLVFMWLKFLVIWRFMRFWALAEGVLPPENMTRCVANNYDIAGFWQNWHASYNLWLVRYMYIPLGGSRWRAANVWPIFSFVALWHDLEWRLLGWAWIMALFMAPEMVAKWAGRQAWCIADKGSARFKHLCAAAAAANILVLMSANLVGFVVGLDGLLPLLHAVLGQPAFAAGMLCVFFCAAHVMFAIREAEQKAEVRARHKAASLNGEVEHEKGV